MFADISGFTEMSEKMDPEEVTSLINECFEMMSSVIRTVTREKLINIWAIVRWPCSVSQRQLKMHQ